MDFKFQDSPRHAFGLPVLNGKVCEGETYDVFDREISAFMDSVEPLIQERRFIQFSKCLT